MLLTTIFDVSTSTTPVSGIGFGAASGITERVQ